MPLGFIDLWVTPEILLLYLTKTHTSRLTGGTRATFFVPDDSSYHGLQLSLQWCVLDPLAIDGWSHTGGATASIP